MSTFVGGKLKLKGGVDPTQLNKAGVKKKKKKKRAAAAAAAADAQAIVPVDGGDGGDQQAAAAGDKASAVVSVTKDGVVLDPSAVADRRTAAEKRAEEHFLKYEEVRNRKAAAMSHRERIRDLNEKLSNLTEHNAIFNVSYT